MRTPRAQLDLSRRAVVTGLGAVTPIGNDHPTFWRNLLAGKSGVGADHALRCRPASTCASPRRSRTSTPRSVMDRKMARRMSRFIHLAMGAGKEAVADAGLDFSEWTPEQRDRAAVAINTGGGGIEQVVMRPGDARDEGPGPGQPVRVSGTFSIDGRVPAVDGIRPDRPGHHPVRGVRHSIICFLDALRMIQRGEVDVVLAGGSEAPLLAMGFAALGNMHALSRRNDDPEHASRPFDKNRDGFVYGEGAGVVIVESARARPRPRRDDPGRAHRRGADGRRVPYLRPGARLAAERAWP